MSQVDDPHTALDAGAAPDDVVPDDDVADGTLPESPPTTPDPTTGDGDDGAGDLAGDAPTTATPVAGERPTAPVRKKRSEKRREWRQSERARRFAARKSVRFPIFTRAVLLWMFIFALVGLAFGASGAFWWANFNSQVSQLRDDTKDFESRSQGAAAALEAQRNQALTQINDALSPLASSISEAQTVKLTAGFAPAVWFIKTSDQAGQASVGSAFALTGDESETLMVTSYNTVKASTLTPAPDIFVVKGPEEIKAELWSVDPPNDLALVRVPRGNIPLIEWAADDAQAKVKGMRVFAISGLGGDGATLSPGLGLDTSSWGFQHTITVGTAYQGGPIITPDGKVLGLASLTYWPGLFDPGDVHYSVPIARVCDRILSCGGGKSKREKDVPPDPNATPTTAAPTGATPND